MAVFLSIAAPGVMAQEAAAPVPPAQTAPQPQPSPTAPEAVSAPAATAPTPSAPQTAASSLSANLPHDLSPWAMFMNADLVVKAVMVGLAFASLVTWTIGLAKALELLAAKRRALSGLRQVQEAHDLADATRRVGETKGSGPVGTLVRAAAGEWKRSADLPPDGIKERVAVALSRIEAQSGRRMTRGTGLLATIGSTAPFVGLFGTVWGIMNSFIGISQAQTTNLAVVAPGIAEALLATAIGLVAAIPAVVIYNMFARSIAGYKANLSDASAVILQHLSRDLDRPRAVARPAAPARPNTIRAAE
ncbi:tonB-system energizer ExbB [Microvirga pudoricolor]|uniref:tonB-system energizer ExbB n=1 Tax=Microvirga pudoricolor TaxID=2778729 RepID=UPI00389951EC